MFQFIDYRTIGPISPANAFALRCESAVMLARTLGVSATMMVPQSYVGVATPLTYIQGAGVAAGVLMAAHNMVFNNTDRPGHVETDLKAFRRFSAAQFVAASTAVPSITYDFCRLAKQAANTNMGALTAGFCLSVIGIGAAAMAFRAWQGHKLFHTRII